MKYLGIYISHRGETLSHWPVPSTGDVGIRAFAGTSRNLFREVTLGMQSLKMTEEGKKDSQACIRRTAHWSVMTKNVDSLDLLLLKWLDEVLYRDEVEEAFLVDMQASLNHQNDSITLESQVSYVDSDSIEKGIEIKAVTSHNLVFREILAGIEVSSQHNEVPTFTGPGWYADVLFDI